MKKSILLIAFALLGVSAYSQKIDKNELAQLKTFLNQTNEKGHTNAHDLKITDMNTPSMWHGVKVIDGHVVEIDWRGKDLTGDLSLTNFKYLTTVNVSRNNISKLMLNGCTALLQLNASHNKLSAPWPSRHFQEQN